MVGKLPVMLLVEDDSILRRAMPRQMQGTAEVVVVDSCQAALEAVQARKDEIKLILVDWSLVGEKTAAIIPVLRSTFGPDFPLYGWSGETEGLDQQKALGCTDAFLKPIEDGVIALFKAKLKPAAPPAMPENPLVGAHAKEVLKHLDTPIDEILDRPHADAPDYRLSEARRAELKARIERDFTHIRGFMEEGAFLLGAKVVHDLIGMVLAGEYGAEGHKGSSETEGLVRILPGMEWYLRELHDLTRDG